MKTTSLPPDSPAAVIAERPALPDLDDDELVAGFGVMGQPFASGHVLALRAWSEVSFADPYRAVWHRSPDGRWTFWSDQAPEVSCARYFGAEVDEVTTAPITLSWPTPWQLRVQVEDAVDWLVTMRATPVTRLMSAMCGGMPDAAWRSDRFLKAMGRMSRPLLRTGRLRMAGHVPNGQWFQLAPRRLWTVAQTAATVGGLALGEPGPVSPQAHLADSWLPQRGLVAAGFVRMEALDPDRHLAAGAHR